MVLKYSTDELNLLNNGYNYKLDTSIVSRARSLGISTKTKTHRGSKGSKSRIQKIISTDRKTADSGQQGAKLSNLTHININRENFSKQKLLKCASLNARSIRNKTLNINDTVVERDIDILFLSETWLGKDDDDAVIASIKPDGYDFIHHPRLGQEGGGVAILFRQSIKIQLQDHKSYSTFESIEALATVKGHTIRISSIYRPDPYGNNVPAFLGEFSEYIIGITSKPHDITVCGDINFHLDNATDPSTENLLTVLESCNLKQHIQTPTHRNAHILDIVISSDSTSFSMDTPTVSDLCLSDHFWIEFKINMRKPAPQTRTVTSRKINSIDLTRFSNDIAKLHVQSGDISGVIEQYNNGVKAILDTHAPETTKTVTIRPNTQWYNANLRHAKVVKRRLERRVYKTNSEEAKLAYRKQCDLVSQLRDKAKSEFLSDRVLECGRDQKRLFNVMKGILDWNKKSKYPANIPEDALATAFSEFFIDKIIKIRNAISHDSLVYTFNSIRDNILPDLPDHTGSTLDSFSPATEHEIQLLVMKSPSSSCDLDPVPTSLLKDCLPSFLPHLTRIVNLSLQNCEIPTSLKRAIVRPLLKKASLDPEILKNYRPISNLSFISKLTERLVAKRINTYLTTHALLDKYQSAYRMFHSTESALLRVQSDILAEMDKRKMVALAMLDLSAAFDTIDHSVLIKRLHTKFGICGDALCWIESYLSNRFQCVVINGLSSSDATLGYGVPQGSVLGPLLFTLYVTPLASIATKHGLNYHCYADDTQLYLSFDPKESTDREIQDLEACIASVKRWMQANMLKLNEDKTEFIVFGSPYFSRKLSCLSINVGNANINSTTKVKNLGAFFDRNLSMSAFVMDKLKTAMFYLKNISRIRRYLTTDSAKTIVHAYVVSRLDYANSLLYGINSSLTKRLQTVQNAAARLILNAPRFDHALPLLKSLHWLPIEKRIKFKCLVTIHNCLHGRAPEYLRDFLIEKQSKRTLRSSHERQLVTKRTKTRFGDRAFIFYGPRLWNDLPSDIRSISSFSSFKKV